MPSIVIPAHNESAAILRTLRPLAGLAQRSDVDVVVAANGCTDDTAELARTVPGVIVVEIPVGSKIEALNLAEQRTDRFPRVYLDADIEVTEAAIDAVFDALRAGPALAARPPFRYKTAGASAFVRAYYRARSRLPDNLSALWGAGVYALSQQGRSRFGAFPPVLADDLYVDALFSDEEKAVVPAAPVVVRTPRYSGALLRVLRRQYQGDALLRARLVELEGHDTVPRTGNGSALVRSVTSLPSLVDAAVYATFVVVGRRQARKSPAVWHRDESTRRPEAEHVG